MFEFDLLFTNSSWGVFSARAMTPKARQNSFFRKMLPYFGFFSQNWIFNTLFREWSWKETLTEVNKSWTFQNYTKWHEMSIFRKLPHCFFGIILSLRILIKHPEHQKYRSNIFSNLLRSKKLPYWRGYINSPLLPIIHHNTREGL